MTDRQVTRREFVRDGAIAAAGLAAGIQMAKAAPATQPRILNYNEQMEYRRCGKTELMVSAVCLGGHWKRLEAKGDDFAKNRHDVVSRCIDVGMNYIDACTGQEVLAYSEALRGRRDQMYLGFSYCEKEARYEKFRTAKALLSSFDEMIREAKLDYCDLWRITCFEPGGQHTFDTSQEIVQALETAQKQGKARFVGISSHDRRWLKMMIEEFPQLQVILTPYTSKTKAKPEDSLFDAIKKCDVGFFGIKPFASNSLFKGDSSPNSPDRKEDDERARLAIRYILCNKVITAPIPGLINIDQVNNMARAVKERRELDQKEASTLQRAADEAWAKLPEDYQWLKDWEYV